MGKIKKLVLKKETIASLSRDEQNVIRGGYSEGPCTENTVLTAIYGSDCGNSCVDCGSADSCIGYCGITKSWVSCFVW